MNPISHLSSELLLHYSQNQERPFEILPNRDVFDDLTSLSESAYPTPIFHRLSKKIISTTVQIVLYIDNNFLVTTDLFRFHIIPNEHVLLL
jgi:hypothetical protein